jgi:antitoxin ParD1/3/4
MASNRINTRLSRPLAEFVDGLVGDAGLYETPGEYVRNLIRRDMEQRDGRMVHESILSGYRDLAEGAVFESTGDFKQDMRKLAEKEADGWR